MSGVASNSSGANLPRHVVPLEKAGFLRLKNAGYLKGLLKPFKGKGQLETWASQCNSMRDDLIGLAQRRVLSQAKGYPFNRFAVQLAQQATGAGTTFLRWRNADHSVMGVSLWEQLIASPSTPISLVPDLLALELHRLALNMQPSRPHTTPPQPLHYPPTTPPP